MKISNSTLKIFAIIIMFIDHFASIILNQILVNNNMNEIFASNNEIIINNWIAENPIYNVYLVIRLVGRISFPIFCFLLVEGLYKTNNIKKYIVRLGLFALISEIPFDLAFSDSLANFSYQNVFFTLFIGLLTINSLDYIHKRSVKCEVLYNICIITIGFILAELLKTDYSGFGVLTISAIYITYRHYEKDNDYKYKVYSMFAGCIVLFIMSPIECTSFLSILLVLLYNNKKGLNLKYIFYVFYPLHLVLLWLICTFI